MTQTIRVLRPLLATSRNANPEVLSVAVDAAKRADDTEFLVELARRQDLTGYAHDEIHAMAALPIRAAFLTRPGAPAEEVEQLLATETRAGVLAAVVKAGADNPDLLAQVEAVFMVRPTRALAEALAPDAQRTDVRAKIFEILAPHTPKLSSGLRSSLTSVVRRLCETPEGAHEVATRVHLIKDRSQAREVCASKVMSTADKVAVITYCLQGMVTGDIVDNDSRWKSGGSAAVSLGETIVREPQPPEVLQALKAVCSTPEAVNAAKRDGGSSTINSLNNLMGTINHLLSQSGATLVDGEQPIEELSTADRRAIAQTSTNPQQLAALVDLFIATPSLQDSHVLSELVSNPCTPWDKVALLATATDARLQGHKLVKRLVEAGDVTGDPAALEVRTIVLEREFQSALTGGLLDRLEDPGTQIPAILTRMAAKETSRNGGYHYGGGVNSIVAALATEQEGRHFCHVPMPLLVPQASRYGYSGHASWSERLLAYLAQQLGSDPQKWEQYAVMSETFPGTLDQMMRMMGKLS